jgi:hypothetical protein
VGTGVCVGALVEMVAGGSVVAIDSGIHAFSAATEMTRPDNFKNSRRDRVCLFIIGFLDETKPCKGYARSAYIIINTWVTRHHPKLVILVIHLLDRIDIFVEAPEVVYPQGVHNCAFF